jgi:hypothetical protein
VHWKVIHFYNQRGKAEQWIKEGKQAVKMTPLSCYRFRGNEVRPRLSIIAYNLGNLLRRLVKTGGRLVNHARGNWLMLAEGHLTRGRFAATDRAVAPSGKLTMIARPVNRITEEK